MGWNAYLYVQGCKNFEPSGECLRCDHRVGEWNYTAVERPDLVWSVHG